MTYKVYNSIETETNVSGASPHRLVQLLFEKCIQNINLAKIHLSNKDIKNKCLSIGKAMDIVNYLRISLNDSDEKARELSKHLDVVYQYVDKMLLQANIKNDEKYLNDALDKMTQIKLAWDKMKVEEYERENS